MSALSGRAWVFGDNVDTDVLAPGIYMKSPLSELAQHCLESVDPDFARNVAPGDIVVAGENFGMGSSREQAAQALIELGVAALVAKSFARIFYRNAINLGLPALVCPEADRIKAGDGLTLDRATARSGPGRDPIARVDRYQRQGNLCRPGQRPQAVEI